MASEKEPIVILVPIRRRHAASRASLETIVTRAKHWGYAENEDLILVRRANTARRYFSRSSLMEPNSVYTRMVVCEATEITINNQQGDVDTIISTDNEQYALFVDGGTDNVGMGTNEPLQNVIGGAANDFTGHGLHVESDSGENAHIIIEGWAANGRRASGLVLANNSGTGDNKIVQLFNENDRFAIEVLYDDGMAVKYGDVILVDMATGNVGIGGVTTPDGSLHVQTATAGSVTANVDSDDIVAENSGSGGISILVPDASVSQLAFGCPSDNDGARISWQYSVADLNIITDIASADIAFYSGSSDFAMIIDSNQNVGIGETNGPTANGGKVLYFGDNTADPTMASNTCGFYGKDVAGTVEAFAVDEAGNAAQLTSHDTDGNWVSNTYMKKGSKRVWKKYQMEVLMNELIKLLDANGRDTSGLYEKYEETI